MEGQPPQNSAKQRPDQMIAPKQPSSGIKGEQNKASQKPETKEKISQPAQLWVPSPEGAEQIIQKACRDPQHYGQEKFQPLYADRQRHQPKSRAKKPPASRAVSS